MDYEAVRDGSLRFDDHRCGIAFDPNSERCAKGERKTRASDIGKRFGPPGLVPDGQGRRRWYRWREPRRLGAQADEYEAVRSLRMHRLAPRRGI